LHHDEEWPKVPTVALTSLFIFAHAEVSDLIGQWLPVRPKEIASSARLQARAFIGKVIKHLLLMVLPVVADQSPVVKAVEGIQQLIKSSALESSSLSIDQGGISNAGGDATMARHVDCQQLLEDLQDALHTLHALDCPAPVARATSMLLQQLGSLSARLQDASNQKGLTFIWVESPLVEAIKDGHWVCSLTSYSQYFMLFNAIFC
jgi:hypothetical protein